MRKFKEFEVKKLKVKVQTFVEPETGMFHASYGEERFRNETFAGLTAEIKEHVFKTEALQWEPIIDVVIEMASPGHRAASFGFTLRLQRYYIARRGGEWAYVDWDIPTENRLINAHSISFHRGVDRKTLVSVSPDLGARPCTIYERRGYTGWDFDERHVLDYSDELYAGLLALGAKLEELRLKLADLIGSKSGLFRIQQQGGMKLLLELGGEK